jgi:hypothetical protein
VVDQNSPEDLRAEGEKVSAVFAPDATCPNQLEIGFIGERGRFQRLTVASAAEVLPSDSPQFRVDRGHQPIECLRIAAAPGREQCAYVRWSHEAHALG